MILTSSTMKINIKKQNIFKHLSKVLTNFSNAISIGLITNTPSARVYQQTPRQINNIKKTKKTLDFRIPL